MNIDVNNGQITEIQKSSELTARLNQFVASSGEFKLTPVGGATEYKSNNEIDRLIAHKVGHATGVIQAGDTRAYVTPEAFSNARGRGEGEAMWLDYVAANDNLQNRQPSATPGGTTYKQQNYFTGPPSRLGAQPARQHRRPVARGQTPRPQSQATPQHTRAAVAHSLVHFW